jgi:hypothetical protein
VKENLLELVNRMPPAMCRCCARKNRGYAFLSTREMAALSGLARTTVAALSKKTTWEGVPVDTMVKFSLACGVNHLRARRQVEYIRRSKVVHMKYSRGRQRKFFMDLLRILSPSPPIQSLTPTLPPLAGMPASPVHRLTP